jgi:hypothetical protein
MGQDWLPPGYGPGNGGMNRARAINPVFLWIPDAGLHKIKASSAVLCLWQSAMFTGGVKSSPKFNIFGKEACENKSEVTMAHYNKKALA